MVNLLEGIYQKLDEAQNPKDGSVIQETIAINSDETVQYINAVDSEEIKRLRELLLAVHQDEKIAHALAANQIREGVLYNPDPNSFFRKSHNNKFNEDDACLSWYARDDKAVFYKDVFSEEEYILETKFKLVDGKFYANKKELPLHFPKLTASGLEECIREKIVKKDY